MKRTLVNIILFSILLSAYIVSLLANRHGLGEFTYDLTERQIYTLSEGTEEVLSSIEVPINLYYFFSESNSKGITPIRDYARRVESILEQYVQKSNGKIILEKINPEPFSEDEDKAAEFGLSAAATASGQDTLYFGLAGTNSAGDTVVLGFFDPQKEQFLEYDLSSLVYQLDNPEPVNLTIVTDLPIAGGPNPISGQFNPPSALLEQLRAFYSVEIVSNSAQSIGESTELLMLLHPQNMNDDLLFSIDQFLMKGGKAMVFVDPNFESDPMAQMGAYGANSSKLTLLEHYGISVRDDQVVLDAAAGLEIRGANGEVLRHLGFLGLSSAQINQRDIVTAQLESINGASFGHIINKRGSGLSSVSLLTSSKDSDLIALNDYVSLEGPADYARQFSTKNKQMTLAARFRGAVSSYFANSYREGVITRTSKLNLVVVADADITADRFWVQQSNFFGQRVVSPFANNGDFIINTLENLAGSDGLIGIRSRGTFDRPFERVEDLKMKAEAKFREQEKRLQAQLEQTEIRISELQSQLGDGSLNQAQETAIEEFTKEKIEIRKALREVQFELEKDIDYLGNLLKLTNIVIAPPILVLVLFLFHLMVRKKADLKKIQVPQEVKNK